ncbi:DUF1800 domain-containing protein [Aquabacterium lacunae]|uniref:DUF1800 domain-containing protein n=1 Tax=Aquabacterium lacunae TaxID=2528630 RepID=A0A4Q9H405_9BURK|nr:DUF1800 domain-containing protein [Aquabacterium lacunae]TBO34341.1 DUF1800 domain-containing protein [Aquabacterium lacunae]
MQDTVDTPPGLEGGAAHPARSRTDPSRDSQAAIRPPFWQRPAWLAAATSAWLQACGGGEGLPLVQQSTDPVTGLSTLSQLPGYDPIEPPRESGLSAREAARFLMQATFGVRGQSDIDTLQAEGLNHWLWRQFNAPVAEHVSYLDLRRGTDPETGQRREASDEMSYEAIWRQWLFDDAGADRGQLRARVAFALSEIFVISNIAPDIKPYAMSSWMDMLNRHAFGNFRSLLEAVTLHPAMGYYLNMLESEKANEETGSHPNENYAREVLQLFSIGLVKLNADGTAVKDGSVPVPTYTEDVVKGFARAFSGWSFGGQQGGDDLFEGSDYNDDRNWVTPMRAYAAFHEPGTKTLLDGRVLPAGQTPEQDMAQALDCIFQHPNVGPFICRQLIQRLVTSNPSGVYLSQVVAVFNDNGKGVRGDLKAVVRAILLHAEARSEATAARPDFGKLREPLVRFAALMRAFNVQPLDTLGTSNFWALFGGENPLGQHPLLAPSVFNFFAPTTRYPAQLRQAVDGLPVDFFCPEAQITTETNAVGTFNVFRDLIDNWSDPFAVRCDLGPWRALGDRPGALIDRMNALLFAHGMTSATRMRLTTLMAAMPGEGEWPVRERVAAALMLAVVSLDFVVQK